MAIVKSYFILPEFIRGKLGYFAGKLKKLSTDMQYKSISSAALTTCDLGLRKRRKDEGMQEAG
jgi:hypothetical protein